MTAVSLNNLWTYLQSLSLTSNNRDWLAERLIEPRILSRKEQQAQIVSDSFRRGLAEAKSDMPMQSLDSIISDIEDGKL